jgi:hypothetical protein
MHITCSTSHSATFRRMLHTASFARRWPAVVLLAMGLLVGCAAQSPDSRESPASKSETVGSTIDPSAATPPTQPSPTGASPANPASPTPTPIKGGKRAVEADLLAGQAPGLDPGSPDRACNTDSDCAVKDVGNCCGYYPMCVSKNAKTNPEAVRAQCAKSGMASICGFQEVTGCQCVKGRCENLADGAQVM